MRYETISLNASPPQEEASSQNNDFKAYSLNQIFAMYRKHSNGVYSSLEEFKVRFDVDINKAYLDGRYGSVPKFKNIFKSK